jgi:hypothetical protein
MSIPNLKTLLSAGGLAMALATGAAVAFPPQARSGDADLAGTWSGGGPVSFASGSKERAKCRATFSKSSQSSYQLSGSCATQSGKVTQTAEVFKTTANRYRGNFHNPEFDINGTISIVVNGRSMSATLTSSSGSGVLSLSR